MTELTPDETINLGFAPMLADADFDLTPYMESWGFSDRSLPAPTLKGYNLKAAVWLPSPEIQLRDIIEVPVIAVSVDERTEDIDNMDSTWYGGRIPLEILKSARGIALARFAVENTDFGGYKLYEVLGHLESEVEARYVTLPT